MNLIGAKVYFDGGNYIAIPHIEKPYKRRKAPPLLTEQEAEQIEQFEKAFNKSRKGKRSKRKEKLLKQFEPQFDTPEEAAEFVEKHFDRLNRNAWERFKRMERKAYLHQWHYFVTFTFSDELQTEETFRKRLTECLRHLADRRGWKFIGAWERGEIGERLHFHALVYIPDGQMVGELQTIKEYSTKRHKWEEKVINTFFGERFGKTEFDKIESSFDISNSIAYMVKYMTKYNEKPVYSRGLPTYFISDILDEDIICPLNNNEHDIRFILSQHFTCIVEGEIIGEVSPEVIEKMPKAV